MRTTFYACAAVVVLAFTCLCAVCVPGRAGEPARAAQSTDTEWVNWAVVNVCPTRIYLDAWRSDEKRMELYSEFDPDIADWWSGVARPA